MLFVYGTKRKKIKQYDDFLVGCEDCLNLGVRYIIYQEYFHIFFIPIRPFPIKTVKSYCLKCGSYNEKKANYYISKTRSPVYLYSAPILFLLFILMIILAVFISNNQEKNYINNPEKGDVYCIKNNNNDSTTYYFLKVNSINGDTLELYHSLYSYYNYPIHMDRSDSFISCESLKTLKSEIKKKYNEDIIMSVQRNK